MAKVRIDARRIERRIERKHEPRIRRALQSGYIAAWEAYRDKRPVLPAISIAHEPILDELKAIYTEAFIETGVQTWRTIRRRAGIKQFQFVDMPEELRRGLQSFIDREAGRKITQMNRTTQDRIAQLVQRAIEEGTPLGPDVDSGRGVPLGQRILDIVPEDIMKLAGFDVRYRAHMIARTETHGASQAAALEAAEATGVVKGKEWVFADDRRVRDGENSPFDHTNVQPVGINEPFLVSGELLDYPGDPAGSAGNVINCRCQVTFIV
jgi:hypothetical protein